MKKRRQIVRTLPYYRLVPLTEQTRASVSAALIRWSCAGLGYMHWLFTAKYDRVRRGTMDALDLPALLYDLGVLPHSPAVSALSSALVDRVGTYRRAASDQGAVQLRGLEQALHQGESPSRLTAFEARSTYTPHVRFCCILPDHPGLCGEILLSRVLRLSHLLHGDTLQQLHMYMVHYVLVSGHPTPKYSCWYQASF